MGLFSRSPSTRQQTNSIGHVADASYGNASLTPQQTPSPVILRIRNTLRIKRRQTNASASPPTQPTVATEKPSSCDIGGNRAGARPTAPSPLRHELAKLKTEAPARPTSDAVTMTLAQRLGELSTANSEGLLDDDEYRMLRQSLFERLAGDTTVPSEPSIIPHTLNTSTLRTRKVHASTSAPRREEKPPSITNASIRSNTSLVSRFSTLIRRRTQTSPSAKRSSFLTSRTSVEEDNTMQVASLRTSTSTQRPSIKPESVLVHHASQSSIRANGSINHANLQSDSKSVSSFKTQQTSRSTHAPSSFRLRSKDTGFNADPFLNDASIYDDEHLTTSSRIKAEIANVEKELHGLMDAFRGLEMSIQLEPQGHRKRSHSKSISQHSKTSPFGSNTSLVPNGEATGSPNTSTTYLPSITRSISNSSLTKCSLPKRAAMPNFAGVGSSYKPYGANGDVKHPAGPSASRPSYESSPTRLRPRNGRTLSNASSLISSPGSPQRPPHQVQLGSPFSDTRRITAGTGQTSVSASLSAPAQINGSARAVVLHPPVSTGLSIDVREENEELSDVRRRKDEVSRRYEARLDFLRAKLKGMEMRERLSKK